jgi:hypothetical protein
MTPFDYAGAKDCEFFGGPVDGLVMRVKNSTGQEVFSLYAHEVTGVKDCGVPRSVAPHYNRINDRRFQFVGYR